MELRQLRYFVRVVEHGSMGKAALELGVVTSALSQQISRLESELSTRLLQRTSTGVVPTDAGLAFWRQAQLALRHVDDAALAARQARLSGHVSVGLAPSTTGVLALAFMQAMRQRYPDVRLRMVESLSGYLGAMLSARQIDLAILFREEPAQRWSVMPLLDEHLFVIGAPGLPGMPNGPHVRLADLGAMPLILPSGPHGLRALLDAAFARTGFTPHIAAEVDGLAMLMDAVRGGLGATIQPGAALARLENATLTSVPVADAHATRPNVIASVSDDELSPAGLAARVVLADVAREIVAARGWPGATLREPPLHKN
ncbi:LysR family transcriptional regulator [Burkholderia cenocepacia]|uniref:LysR family transcriptional regulator n=1 Tax=Burkholderia cenocepacia TaxID=95486 RepID=UPI000F5660D9|nr:LysR substrate-binding domain-containing protein [Burkholderia cenocepacia]ELK7721922.1 LysR family transcriptional regulator [Burkholderia cenocepacia]MBR8306524.1 LysR family transcriptional regulator [Burkholderia cenocepacia]MCF1371136.1 LysR family transcriptional regulator [Burkholderia cenocepacia]MCF1388615.1 LysR family transcriptional regulator [Burkholderia cenocepacia]RQU77646.1 LysR family transcriptional regulator [Burkholderia cenocepacia]